MAIRTRTFLILFSSWVALSMACNLSSASQAAPSGPGASPTAPQPTAPVAAPTDTPTVAPTPTNALTATPTATPTSSTPMVSPISKDVPCLFGPGTVYSVEGALAAGSSVPIQGRDSLGAWWYIANPSHSGRYCWVPSSSTQTQGDTSIVGVQAPPVPFVDDVGVEMDPSSKSIGCGTFPFTFDVSISIEWNGPLTLTFQRIKSNGSSAPPETYTFAAAGSQRYSDSYRVGAAGTYWFEVQVTSPNKIASKGSATVTCH